MVEFEIKGKQFKTGSLNAFQQLRITKRLIPIFAGISSTIGTGESDIQKMMSSLAQSLSSLNDSDLEDIILTALSGAYMKIGSSWIVLSKDKTLTTDDLSLFELIKVTVEVIKDNLTDFFTEIQEESNNMLTTQE